MLHTTETSHMPLYGNIAQIYYKFTMVIPNAYMFSHMLLVIEKAINPSGGVQLYALQWSYVFYPLHVPMCRG